MRLTKIATQIRLAGEITPELLKEMEEQFYAFPLKDWTEANMDDDTPESISIWFFDRVGKPLGISGKELQDAFKKNSPDAWSSLVEAWDAETESW